MNNTVANPMRRFDIALRNSISRIHNSSDLQTRELGSIDGPEAAEKALDYIAWDAIVCNDYNQILAEIDLSDQDVTVEPQQGAYTEYSAPILIDLNGRLTRAKMTLRVNYANDLCFAFIR